MAVNHSHYSWIEASNVLAYIYLHLERDYDNSERILLPLIESYPGHPYFTLLYGELLAKSKQWDALEKFMPTLESLATQGPMLQQNECRLKLHYIQGLKAFHHQKYLQTIDHCNWMLNNYHMEFDWLKGFAYFLRGNAFEASGQPIPALTDYKKVLNMESYYPEVEEAREKIALLIKNDN